MLFCQYSLLSVLCYLTFFTLFHRTNFLIKSNLSVLFFMDHAFGVSSGHHHGQGHLGFVLFKEFESPVFYIWMIPSEFVFVKGLRSVRLFSVLPVDTVGPAPFVLYLLFKTVNQLFITGATPAWAEYMFYVLLDLMSFFICEDFCVSP